MQDLSLQENQKEIIKNDEDSDVVLKRIDVEPQHSQTRKLKAPEKFNLPIPETQREEYLKMKEVIGTQETYSEEVEDIYEMQLLSKELNNDRILTPELVAEKIVPRL